MRGTPERIELENYRLSLQREEELEEVPEETLAEHNLSSVLDKGTEEDVPSRLVHSDHKLSYNGPNRLLPVVPLAFFGLFFNILFARLLFLKFLEVFHVCTQIFYVVVSVLLNNLLPFLEDNYNTIMPWITIVPSVLSSSVLNWKEILNFIYLF